MVVGAVSTILFILLVAIYFVVKAQNLQKQLREYRYLARTAQKKSKFTLTTLDSLASQIQKVLLSQLESSHKRGLVKGEDYDKTKAIFSSFEAVVMQCCEHGATVEEAVRKCMAKQEVDMEELTKFVSTLPSDVRLAWVKNNVASFVLACTNINNYLMNPTAKKEKMTEQAS